MLWEWTSRKDGAHCGPVRTLLLSQDLPSQSHLNISACFAFSLQGPSLVVLSLLKDKGGKLDGNYSSFVQTLTCSKLKQKLPLLIDIII